MLLNPANRVWIGRRIPKWGGDGKNALWQMPQGGIDKGENAATAALRELQEETGTAAAEILYESRHWYSYDLPHHAVGTALNGKYRGQTQRWFLMRFTGSDEEFTLTPPDGEMAEFDDWKWVDFANLCDLVVPFKRDVYTQVVQEFAPVIKAL